MTPDAIALLLAGLVIYAGLAVILGKLCGFNDREPRP